MPSWIFKEKSMAISSEFVQAVRDGNKLRVRIMLKDSLLVDKTFRLFDEMQAYASAQGVSPWADADIPLEKTEKPWSEDTMNYELTALVNDFTKEHVNYVKAIIAEVYKDSLPVLQPVRNTSISQSVSQPVNRPTSSIIGTEDPHKTILNKASSINRILRNNKDETTGKRTWMNEDIDRIRRHAQKIVDACNRLIEKEGLK